jgi:hypothetical protein
MELEHYFHRIQQERKMAEKKDTRVSFSIEDNNDDLEGFPTTYRQQHIDYSCPTWIQIVEDVLKMLEVEFGYPIRSQVYYSVMFPVFDHNYSYAPGRELDQKKFLELLAENPEINNGGEHKPFDL